MKEKVETGRDLTNAAFCITFNQNINFSFNIVKILNYTQRKSFK